MKIARYINSCRLISSYAKHTSLCACIANIRASMYHESFVADLCRLPLPTRTAPYSIRQDCRYTYREEAQARERDLVQVVVHACNVFVGLLGGRVYARRHVDLIRDAKGCCTGVVQRKGAKGLSASYVCSDELNHIGISFSLFARLNPPEIPPPLTTNPGYVATHRLSLVTCVMAKSLPFVFRPYTDDEDANMTLTPG